MNYIKVEFICDPNTEIVSNILSACMGEIGFESFEETINGIAGYIPESLFDEKVIKEVVTTFPVEAGISYSWELIVGRDWNEEWEKNYFKPLVIDNRCVIQSTFHEVEGEYEYQIFIDPKMAFGTGHHQTTELMIREILKIGLFKESVLDMGCGTAILAILASMGGADPITAIDIDKWAYDNAMENLRLNNIENVEVLIGGAELLGEKCYDAIFANINRNILLNDIHVYASVLNKGGALFMSGFYIEDIDTIREECTKHNLVFEHSAAKDNWAVVKFIK